MLARRRWKEQLQAVSRPAPDRRQETAGWLVWAQHCRLGPVRQARQDDLEKVGHVPPASGCCVRITSEWIGRRVHSGSLEDHKRIRVACVHPSRNCIPLCADLYP